MEKEQKEFMAIESQMKYDEKGLIPVIIQDHQTKQVLMLAYMNQASFEKSMETGQTHFWSRSRQKYWLKGESSGHFQRIKKIYTDCDKDTILIEVEQKGGACHNGFFSCFYREISPSKKTMKTIAKTVFDPAQKYSK